MLRDSFRTAEDDGKSVWRTLHAAANESGAIGQRELRASLASLGISASDAEMGEARGAAICALGDVTLNFCVCGSAVLCRSSHTCFGLGNRLMLLIGMNLVFGCTVVRVGVKNG
jgi:hypothetical protein